MSLVAGVKIYECWLPESRTMSLVAGVKNYECWLYEARSMSAGCMSQEL